MKYPNVNAGQTEAMINCLGGMEMMRLFLAGKLQVVPRILLNAWKTITLIPGLDALDICRSLEEHGYSLFGVASEMLEHPDCKALDHPAQIDLVTITGEEMGLSRSGNRCKYVLSEIYARAQRFGLVPCPAQTGPQLIIQEALVLTENICVAIEPLKIGNREGASFIWQLFRSSHYSSNLLSSCGAAPDVGFRPETRWIFARGKREDGR